MQLTISAYSTALYSTWYFIKEFRLLFDAGDGLSSTLLGACGKIREVFISHADRDHLTGLLQFNQLNAKPGHPNIYYPKDALSIKAFGEFSKLFDKKVAGSVWTGIDTNEVITLKNDLQVSSLRNGHVRAPDQLIKSLGYLVQKTKRKLKPEYRDLNKQEIMKLRNKLGEEAITMMLAENILGYSGDTPAENFEKWNGCKVLIHEATFLHREEITDPEHRYNLHSTLDDVIAHSAKIELGALVLGHFSSRYKPAEIDEAIKVFCRQSGPAFPVYRILPGVYYPDVLSKTSDALVWVPEGNDEL